MTNVDGLVMYGCESWTIKKAESWRIDAFKLWCWRRLLRVPWTTRRSNLLILREINLEYSLEGLEFFQCWWWSWSSDDAEVEAMILWPPDVKSQFIGKDLDAGKDWRQKEKRVAEDEMVRYRHQLKGHEFEQTQRDSEGQGSLVCYSLWSCKESDMT